MSASHISFRLWLARWFGIGPATDAKPGSDVSLTPNEATDEEGPLFSLGETKQDVVVSYRAPQTDKS